MNAILDKHAPKQSITLKNGGAKPWYDDEIHVARRQRRKLERKYLKSKLTIHKDMLKEQSRSVVRLIEQKKTTFYRERFTAADSKETFRLVNGLLSAQNGTILPPGDDDQSLAQSFATFFKDKVEGIHASLNPADNTRSDADVRDSTATRPYLLTEFTPVTEGDVERVIKQSANKTCSLDPLPTSMMKEPTILQHILPTITKIMNASLLSASVPNDFKMAQVIPKLKKEGLDPSYSNYRPVSNLPFASKVLEKIVAGQLNSYLSAHGLFDPLQSAYRKGHSTETALLKIKADTDHILDDGDGVLLVLLDLSAAFDTIDHQILINRLENTLHISGNALKWIESYLSNRKQRVHINDAASESVSLSTGVPQGSVLGPLLFILYILPLSDIIEKYNIKRHGYADDTQLYCKLQLGSRNDLQRNVTEMEKCIDEIRNWMACNKLKLNEKKTEVLIITRKTHKPLVEDIKVRIGDCHITPVQHVRNLGGIFDSTMDMKKQVSQTVKSGYFHLRRIKHLRRYLDDKTCARVINATVTSRIDFHNGLLCGSHKVIVKPLQNLQNNAARLLTGTDRFSHITPVLRRLHWIPVELRIDFKILCLVHSSLHQNDSPEYFRTMFVPYQPPRSLRSSADPWVLQQPRYHRHEGQRSMACYGALKWNSLPEYLRKPMPKDVFKKSLKTHMFLLAFTN